MKITLLKYRLKLMWLLATGWSYEQVYILDMLKGTYAQTGENGRSETVTLSPVSPLGGIHRVQLVSYRYKRIIRNTEWLSSYNYATRSLTELHGSRCCYFHPENKVLYLDNCIYQRGKSDEKTALL